MASSTLTVSSCSHTHWEHLFEAPLCEHLSTVQKIVHIVFHIFTLAIPWIFYQLSSWFFCSVPKEHLASPELCAEALAFARAELEKEPGAPFHFFSEDFQNMGNARQPCNLEISRLYTILAPIERNFRQTLERNPNDPWSKKEVIDAADTYFKVCYAISILALEDLPAFQEMWDVTAANALTSKNSYQFRTSFLCPIAYNWLRNKATSDGYEYVFPRNLSNEEVESFYQPGTIQCQWRQLYNDYCHRIGQITAREELDSKLVRWTKKDQGFEFVRPHEALLPYNPNYLA